MLLWISWLAHSFNQELHISSKPIQPNPSPPHLYPCPKLTQVGIWQKKQKDQKQGYETGT